MTRKLSVTESRKLPQFLGLCRTRNRALRSRFVDMWPSIFCALHSCECSKLRRSRKSRDFRACIYRKLNSTGLSLCCEENRPNGSCRAVHYRGLRHVPCTLIMGGGACVRAELDACATIHRCFQSVDLPLGLAIAPFLCDCVPHSVNVSMKNPSKSSYGRDAGALSVVKLSIGVEL
jgi:hypothetical protein